MFSKTQQASHCSQLADLLGTRRVSEYNHGTYYLENHNGCGTVACALGWAAVKGIAGLRLNSRGGSDYRAPSILDEDNRELGTLTAANLVFGEMAFEEIFSSSRHMEGTADDWCTTDDRGLHDSITLLRARAARLNAEATNDASRLQEMPA